MDKIKEIIMIRVNIIRDLGLVNFIGVLLFLTGLLMFGIVVVVSLYKFLFYIFTYKVGFEVSMWFGGLLLLGVFIGRFFGEY